MNARSSSNIMVAGALLGLVGVAVGAFGAHGLRGEVPARDLEIWQTGAHYQQLHAVVLVVVGVLLRARPTRALRVSAALLTAGILVFSGTLYAMVLGAPRMLGAITPIGGLSLMGGWLSLAAHGFTLRRTSE